MDPSDRLKILINSNTPIVAVETVEEARVLALVRETCTELNLPLFEWSIADGLIRSIASHKERTEEKRRTMLAEFASVIANDEAGMRAPDPAMSSGPILNTREPAGVLAHIQSLTTDGVFVLKDFHRHMDDAIVVRRLRDVAQQFAATRRALVLTGPAIKFPPELEKEIEYLDFPLPDRARLRQIVDETFARLSKTYKLKRNADGEAMD